MAKRKLTGESEVKLGEPVIVKEGELPVGVVNREAYDKYMENKAFLNSVKALKVSDGRTFNFCQTRDRILKFIKPLPKAEQEELLALHDRIRSATGKMSVMKRTMYSETGDYVRADDILAKRKEELIDLHVHWCSEKEIYDIVNKQWGYQNISQAVLRKFYNRYKEKIMLLRQQVDNDVSDINVAVKRNRLNTLNFLLMDRIQIYEKSHNRDDSKEIRGILEQAKKEVDGEIIKLDISGKIDIEQTLSIEYQNTNLSKMILNQIILSRVSAKLGCNPMLLLHRLTTSYYNKFNGFKRNDNLDNKPIYPSTIPYDFNELSGQYEKIINSEEKINQLPTITQEQQPKILSVRETLIQKLALKNKELDEKMKGVKDILTK